MLEEMHDPVLSQPICQVGSEPPLLSSEKNFVHGHFCYLVRGDRDSRANLMPIYGDLYQIKL